MLLFDRKSSNIVSASLLFDLQKFHRLFQRLLPLLSYLLEINVVIDAVLIIFVSHNFSPEMVPQPPIKTFLANGNLILLFHFHEPLKSDSVIFLPSTNVEFISIKGDLHDIVDLGPVFLQ